MNLTAITQPDQVATLHLLDCAALLPLCPLAGKTVIDVGTGAGLPGMVLALLTPDARFTLLDSLGKRIDFLREVCDDMGLPHVTSVHARAEDFAAQHRERYDVAVSRAVAQLNVLCELTLPLTDNRMVGQGSGYHSAVLRKGKCCKSCFGTLRLFQSRSDCLWGWPKRH